MRWTTSTSTPPRSASTGAMGPAASLAARLGLEVTDPALLQQALVHSSYLHEHPDLGDELLLGEGEAALGGRGRPSLLASALEALAGALYLDIGYTRTRDWVIELCLPELDSDASILTLKSPKSRLQEHTQRTSGERPLYRVLAATGPDHEKTFRIEVVVGGRVLGAGEGPSRRMAAIMWACRVKGDCQR